jgi:hypothetical protein
MIKDAIVFVVANYSLTFLIIGFVAALIAIARAPKPVSPTTVFEALLVWFVFFSVGVDNAYNFVIHAFFGAIAAHFIGWADSPFQFEVATASLGFAAVGFFAVFRKIDVRFAAILGPSVFTLGDAYGHVHQMIVAGNFAPGNAGPIFYTDIIVPIIGFALVWLRWNASARTVPRHEV